MFESPRFAVGPPVEGAIDDIVGIRIGGRTDGFHGESQVHAIRMPLEARRIPIGNFGTAVLVP